MKITILGSTGSIGSNTLDVIARNPDQFEIVALTAHRNVDLLFKQCVQFKPQYAVVSEQNDALRLKEKLHQNHVKTTVLSGSNALVEVASLPEVDTVMAAMVGAAGLLPALAAARAGKRILLANKEVLVMAGELFMKTVRQSGALLLPVDSEHNAIFQCLPPDFRPGEMSKGVRRIILTASGGAFRDVPLAELAKVTPAQACTHPNWNMGRKVTVDSATMMNKALEVIEAHWLFGVPPEKIVTLLHPQSIVHSLVEYQDGSMLAQLGCPDMRVPIANCLAWPNRVSSGAEFLDLIAMKHLDFELLDIKRYPALQLGYQALKIGGTATTILNAANEECVTAFLEGQITFMDIAKINEEILATIPSQSMSSLEIILSADRIARTEVRKLIAGVQV